MPTQVLPTTGKEMYGAMSEVHTVVLKIQVFWDVTLSLEV